MSTRREWFAAAGAGAALAALSPLMFLAGCDRSTDAGAAGGELAMNGAAEGATSSEAPLVRVRKNPGCGCCDKWAEHMEANGFRVEASEDPGIYEYKQQLGIPRELVSCHTAEVDGYVVEGHVPADLVQRMLREKPAIVGIAVGGMPMGSPGMEGFRKDDYDVVAFRKDGTQMVYASR